ncbi:MAG: dTDP-4-dehydrorhamnose reductase [Candidatus Aminicenantes bacterium]|nr:dTDP-4-dehydrorhamnose reductase [Candidatus Aminicenantes bacterium]
MKMALIGADGQLGSDLSKKMDKDTTFFLNFPSFDITKPESLTKTLYEINPTIVFNTASFNRVDECEEFPQQAIDINALGVRTLSQVCSVLGATLVHFSTDYVFDGRTSQPYTEKDTPNPLNVYGQTKLDGENFVRSLVEKYFLIRTCGLFGEAGCWGKGTNFVDAMVRASEKKQPIRVVNNQTVTPTSTYELADRVIELIQTGEFGLYHMTNEGQCTWYEFAQMIFELMGRDVDLIPVHSDEYGAAAVRPAFSVLDNWKARSIGLTPFSHWTKALEVYMVTKGYLT